MIVFIVSQIRDAVTIPQHQPSVRFHLCPTDMRRTDTNTCDSAYGLKTIGIRRIHFFSIQGELIFDDVIKKMISLLTDLFSLDTSGTTTLLRYLKLGLTCASTLSFGPAAIDATNFSNIATPKSSTWSTCSILSNGPLVFRYFWIFCNRPLVMLYLEHSTHSSYQVDHFSYEFSTVGCQSPRVIVDAHLVQYTEYLIRRFSVVFWEAQARKYWGRFLSVGIDFRVKQVGWGLKMIIIKWQIIESFESHETRHRFYSSDHAESLSLSLSLSHLPVGLSTTSYTKWQRFYSWWYWVSQGGGGGGILFVNNRWRIDESQVPTARQQICSKPDKLQLFSSAILSPYLVARGPWTVAAWWQASATLAWTEYTYVDRSLNRHWLLYLYRMSYVFGIRISLASVPSR